MQTSYGEKKRKKSHDVFGELFSRPLAMPYRRRRIFTLKKSQNFPPVRSARIPVLPLADIRISDRRYERTH
jgi:hypothetical protein